MLRRNKIQIAITLEPDQWDSISRIAEKRRAETKQNVSNTQLIREAVTRFITQEEEATNEQH